MLISYKLPSNIFKREMTDFFCHMLNERSKDDQDISVVGAFLDALKFKKPEAYNLYISSMILIYFELLKSNRWYKREVPDIFSNQELEIFAQFLKTINDYHDLNELESLDNHLLFIFLTALVNYSNFDSEEQDSLTMNCRKEYVNFYERFNPNNKHDEMIIRIKRNLSSEELFIQTVLKTFIKIQKEGYSFKYAIKHTCDLLYKYGPAFPVEQYNAGMKRLIMDYYVFTKGLIELGIEIDNVDNKLINFIEDKNNSYEMILAFVSDDDNCKNFMIGCINYNICMPSYFYETLNTIDSQKGFRKEIIKRFNN